jgi:hypothetical protein
MLILTSKGLLPAPDHIHERLQARSHSGFPGMFVYHQGHKGYIPCGFAPFNKLVNKSQTAAKGVNATAQHVMPNGNVLLEELYR